MEILELLSVLGDNAPLVLANTCDTFSLGGFPRQTMSLLPRKIEYPHVLIMLLGQTYGFSTAGMSKAVCFVCRKHMMLVFVF